MRGVRESHPLTSLTLFLTFAPLFFKQIKNAYDMKNLFALSALTVLTLAVACKGVDKEMIGKMEADLSKMEGMAPAFEALNTSITNVANQLNAAPEAMKTQSNTEYQNMLRISNTMTQKYQATLAEQSDLTGKLKTLIADYTSGKIKTEDAMKEYQTLSTGIQGISEVMDRMNQRAERMQADFAKMSATWNAKAEEAAQ